LPRVAQTHLGKGLMQFLVPWSRGVHIRYF
jgi:hypothetical protein